MLLARCLFWDDKLGFGAGTKTLPSLTHSQYGSEKDGNSAMLRFIFDREILCFFFFIKSIL